MLPHLDANAGVSTSGTVGVANSGGNSVSTGLGASVLFFDFGRTPLQYRSSGKALDAARYDRQETAQSINLNARSAYFSYLLALQVLAVNEDALKQAQIHYNQAKTLFDVGKQAEIALTKANVDIANAQVNVIHARNALSLSRVQLETTAGTQIRDPLELTDSLGGGEDSIGLNDALTQAMAERPELLSARARLDIVKLQYRLARLSFLPSASASAGYSWRASDPSGLSAPDWSKPGWNLGAGISVPLYQGGATYASLLQAGASERQSQASLDATTQNITMQVQQQYLQEADARQRIAATAVLVEQADQGLRMSQERYHEGLANSVEITDAEQTLAAARTSHIQAQFDYRMAHANLLLAIGALHD